MLIEKYKNKNNKLNWKAFLMLDVKNRSVDFYIS